MFSKIKVFFAENKVVHRLFEATILLKGIHGIWETVVGFLFLVLSRETIIKFIFLVTQNNLSINTKDFIGFYLLFYGVINLFLVVLLLKNKIWAYPTAIVLFILFLIYQIHRYFITYSGILLFLIILDIVVILLTWLEYKKLCKKIS